MKEEIEVIVQIVTEKRNVERNVNVLVIRIAKNDQDQENVINVTKNAKNESQMYSEMAKLKLRRNLLMVS